MSNTKIDFEAFLRKTFRSPLDAIAGFLLKIGLTTTLKNAWTTSRRVNFLWVANFNLKFGTLERIKKSSLNWIIQLLNATAVMVRWLNMTSRKNLKSLI